MMIINFQFLQLRHLRQGWNHQDSFQMAGGGESSSVEEKAQNDFQTTRLQLIEMINELFANTKVTCHHEKLPNNIIDGLVKSPSTGRGALRAGRRWGWNHPNLFRMAGEEKSSPVEQKGAKRLFARSSYLMGYS